MTFPNRRYSIIYADPPWSYRDKKTNGYGGAENHYRTMPIAQIKDLPVADIAEENCILFLWATFPNLQEALDVIISWGFKYKTLGFSWLKTYKTGKPFFGIGHYTRSNNEVCLIATKGRPSISSHCVSSVIISPIERHSKKPDICREKIVELCGDVARIELFAREWTPGWDCWGNEV